MKSLSHNKVLKKHRLAIGILFIIMVMSGLAIITIPKSTKKTIQTDKTQPIIISDGLLATVSAVMKDAQQKLSQAEVIAQKKNADASDHEKVVTLVQDAITDGRLAVSAQPDKAMTWYQLGQTYRKLIGFGTNSDEFALLALQETIKIEPKNFFYHFQLGSLYYQLKKYNEAVTEFQTAITLKPGDPNLYYNLAYSYKSLGQRDKAKVAFQKALSFMPKDGKDRSLLEKELKAF